MQKADSKKTLFFYTLLFLCIIGMDRLTKMWALTLEYEKVLCRFLSLELAFNRGVTWGLLSESGASRAMLVLSTIALVLFGMGIYTYYSWREKKPILGNVLILAGGISNFVDRFFYLGVVDFIIVHYNHWMWPAFNIADVAIVLGIGIMLMQQIWNR